MLCCAVMNCVVLYIVELFIQTECIHMHTYAHCSVFSVSVSVSVSVAVLADATQGV